MKIFAETERLILREILPTDVDGMYELDSDPKVHEYLGKDPITDKAQAPETINFIRQQYIDKGIGRWAIIEKTSKNFIGWTGLKLVTEVTNGHVNYYDLGYRLVSEHWGKGYAKESAIASLNYGFEILKLNEIFAIAHLENEPSIRILRKIGLLHLETFSHHNTLHNWYRIGKKEWEQKFQ